MVFLRHAVLSFVFDAQKKFKNCTMEYTLSHLGTTGSTNREAQARIKAGSVGSNTFLTADYQTEGQGRGSNHWHSEPGKNLLMSWISSPAFLSVRTQFQLSKAVSLAICDLLVPRVGSAAIKWPNDILVGERKVCGILIEVNVQGLSIRHAVTGIGLNVNQELFPGFPFPATSLCLETGRITEMEPLRDELIRLLLDRYRELEQGDHRQIDGAYLSSLYGMGQMRSFRTEGKLIQGEITGLSDTGELLVRSRGTERSYGMHEITMVPD